MSTSPSALSSLSSGSSSTTGATYFNGLSTYASSLNAQISQEVQIASEPIQLLQDNVTSLTNQTSELQTLNTDFGAVQTAINSLASAAGNMLTGTVSDPTLATATVSATATAGSYTLEVGSLGSYSDALSNDGLTTVTNPATQNISASDSYTLTVTDGAASPVTTPISFSGGSLNVLAQAINEAGAGVQATVVNVGSNTSPDYRLSLESGQLGPVTMQLNDGAQNLLTATGSAGTLAQYSVNGQSIESDSDSVTLAPGVTLQLTGADPGESAMVTVGADPTQVGSALQSFVTAYNTAMTELNNNRGQTDVALAGQSIIYQLTDQLQSLANYVSGSGAIPSMGALGVSFDDTTGTLSFDQSTFDSATAGQSGALAQFLGSATGGGFLETATNTMTEIMDPTSGSIAQETSSIQSDISNTNTEITNDETSVTQLQNNLTQQMAAADSLIYETEQQNTEIQGMFQAEMDSELMTSTI